MISGANGDVVMQKWYELNEIEPYGIYEWNGS